MCAKYRRFVTSTRNCNNKKIKFVLSPLQRRLTLNTNRIKSTITPKAIFDKEQMSAKYVY